MRSVSKLIESSGNSSLGKLDWKLEMREFTSRLSEKVIEQFRNSDKWTVGSVRNMRITFPKGLQRDSKRSLCIERGSPIIEIMLKRESNNA